MEEQNDFVGITWSWWGAVCAIVMVIMFFGLREFTIGSPNKSVLTPLIGTFVPRHPIIVIAWVVIMSVPLSWLLVRVLVEDDYVNGFYMTYALGLLLVPWTSALLTLPIGFFLPSHGGPIKIVDALLLTGWFVVVSIVTLWITTKVVNSKHRHHDGLDCKLSN